MAAKGVHGESRKKVFEFVKKQLLAGMPPTVREVQQACGFRAVQTARYHLEGLVRDGLLRKTSRKTRSYRLQSRKDAHPQTIFVPLLGQVRAGSFATAHENRDEDVPVEDARAPTQELFALEARGESMVGAGILSGDLLIVRKQSFAQDGDIVVALTGDEATVKRLRVRHQRIELHPENPDFEVIVLDPQEGQILGKVIGVRRHL